MELAILVSIGLVVLAQIMNAATVLIDKHIVTKTTVSRPGVYAFYIAITSAFVLFALPFKPVVAPDTLTILLSLDLGFIFFVSILYLYRAVKHANATDVVAWLAAVSVLTTFVLSNLVLDEKLPASFPFAMVLIIVGMLLVGHFRFYARSFGQTMFSGFLFGLAVVLSKVLYLHAGFWDGFFWSRMGYVAAAIIMLLFPFVYSQLFKITKATPIKTGVLVVFNKILAGIAALLIAYALSIGDASIVNALTSLQFVFIFILIFLLGKQLPDLYSHEFRRGHVLHKILAMIFIVSGFFVLFA